MRHFEELTGSICIWLPYKRIWANGQLRGASPSQMQEMDAAIRAGVCLDPLRAWFSPTKECSKDWANALSTGSASP